MNVLLLKAWLREQGPALIGGRVRSVRQLDPRSFTVTLGCEDGPRELLLSVLEEYPLLAVLPPDEDAAESLLTLDEASVSGSFVKALNFHLSGYQLASLAQEGFDRSVIFTFLHRDMYGKETLKQLRHELVGRASNCFLLSDRGMVISIFKRVRRDQNRVRYIITGKALPPPPPLDKYVAAESGIAGLESELAAASGIELDDPIASLEPFFTQRVAGCDMRLWPRLETQLPVEYDLDSLHQFISQLQRGEFTAQLFSLTEHGDVNHCALAEWSAARRKRNVRPAPSSPRRQRVEARYDQLIEQQQLVEQAELLEAAGMQLLQSAEQYSSSGMALQHLVDWQQQHPQWAALVDPERAVYENAQELIRHAQRLRRGRDKLEQLIATTAAELHELEQRHEPGPKAPPQSALTRLEKQGVKCLKYSSSDGMIILCGTSDQGNDELLRQLSSTRHLWLHARDYPGSHVIVLSDGREVPQRTLEEAALIAGYYSQGRSESALDISYTPLKQLRRPRNGKPGQVLKLSEKVLRINPQAFLDIKHTLQYRG